jgi:NADH-quinone oxidoreductase subunit C
MAAEQVDGAGGEAVDDASSELRVVRAALEVVRRRLPDAAVEVDETPPEGAIKVEARNLVDVAGVLKEDEALRFRLPLFCTAVDWLEREPRFDMVYQLRSLHLRATIRLKVPVADPVEGLPVVPSLSGVFRGMGYLEREVYDLFGVEFDGHPDLRRILMPVDWEGHPLRKDYVSFGEPVKFTDRGSFPPDSLVPGGSEQ